MTLFGLTLLRNKHENKTLTEYVATSALIVFILTGTITPAPAMSFESTLPVALSQKLTTSVEVDRPDYSRRMANILVADHTIKIEKGNWPGIKQSPLVNTATNEPIERVYPSLDEPLILEGEASYYSRAGCLGCSASLTMANGQTLDDNALTMAIGADRKHLVGRTAKVTSLATGLSVDVRITDTGGFYKDRYGNRVADLTIATKTAIGMRGGVGQVRVEVY